MFKNSKSTIDINIVIVLLLIWIWFGFTRCVKYPLGGECRTQILIWVILGISIGVASFTNAMIIRQRLFFSFIIIGIIALSGFIFASQRQIQQEELAVDVDLLYRLLSESAFSLPDNITEKDYPGLEKLDRYYQKISAKSFIIDSPVSMRQYPSSKGKNENEPEE